ncbi:SLC13 family permease [Ferrovibrio sp.]|uniref:SLC13 family permease n=1 Tax=Ferrovibrio sp. TaxID=1917215 RepID=UPI001B460F41|nr:SLC13 family permease [Ferrovibrio sp.]MBP7063481.1 SLC13 family permease [Ferrovibrio sp.]
MSFDQITILILLAAALGLFAWGRWRHDLVALLVLFAALLFGLVPFERAFLGFGHPAVITVAAALVISRAVAATGILDGVALRITRGVKSPSLLLLLLLLPAAIASGFMNNVAALAMVMPVAIAVCASAGQSPSMALMPLSFATMLGGLLTLIGTPPNVIISGIRADKLGEPFHLFDFAMVGGGVALAGLIYTVLIGWRLVPQRSPVAKSDGSDTIGEYLIEASVAPGSSLIGQPLHVAIEKLDGQDAEIIGLLRGSVTIPSAAQWTVVREGDMLLIETAPNMLGDTLRELGLMLLKPKHAVLEDAKTGNLHVAEAVVRPGAEIEGQSVLDLRLRQRHQVNLLGVSRADASQFRGLRNWRFATGDVLLLQGEANRVEETMAQLGLLPLAGRQLSLRPKPGAIATLLIALAGLAALTIGLAPAEICLAGSAIALLLTGRLSLREAYGAIDISVIVLLAAMMPVGDAFEATGTTGLIADLVAGLAGSLAPIWLLAIVIIVTMLVSDILNNAATAVLMAPLAIDLAQRLEVNPDAFLMGVVVGATCAFLTPIGHQNNLLVMGPGGYRFGDYWRLGLPLEIVSLLAALVLIPIFWPL